MERLLALYYVRPGYLRGMANSIIGAARSVRAIAHIKFTSTQYSPHKIGRGPTTVVRGAGVLGVRAVVLWPLGRHGVNHSILHTISGPAGFRGMTRFRKRGEADMATVISARAPVIPPNNASVDLQPRATGESKFTVDPRIKDLLSAAIANSKACQNWLSKPTPNLERAGVSIVHVIRDISDLARMVE